MHYLAIAGRAEVKHFIPYGWPFKELTENMNPADLAAVVIKRGDSRAEGMWHLFEKQLQLPLPLIVIDPEADQKAVAAEIAAKAKSYANQVLPPFLTDLIDFAQRDALMLATPGHHNGHFYQRHPAGAALYNFLGDNFFKFDVSDTLPELGDMMTHEGTPLTAQKQAAKAFNADKVYFCTNGTTSSNTICAQALLKQGDLVLFDRNNHKSLYNSALIMTGAKPVYLPTDRNADGLIGPLTKEALDEDRIRQEIAKVDPARAQAKRPFRMAVLQLETYDGIFYDARLLLKKLGKLCDYILFDCAWGGYEQFVKVLDGTSPLAQEYGPDDPGILVTQSIHKQQAGMTQVSQILKKDRHIKGQARYVDHKHFNHAYLKYVTTSYSYPLYASLVVNAAMAASPACRSWWDETTRLGIEFRKALLKESKLFKPLIPKYFHGQKWEEVPTEVLANDPEAWKLHPDDAWHGFRKIADGEALISPEKVTVMNPGIDLEQEEFTDQGIPGSVVEEFLHERGIIPEKSDSYSTLYLLTPGESEAEMRTVLDALLDFEKAYENHAPLSEVMPRLYCQHADRYQGYTLDQLCQEIHEYYKQSQIFKYQQELFLKPSFQDYQMLPSQADLAFNESRSELVKLDDLEGRTALEGALPYPPGVFVVAPGEKWQKGDIDYFKILIGCAHKFPGFDPEIQGVYQEDEDGQVQVYGEVLKED
ncbi:putative ornithine decarboxylase [uncultured Lactobacillus sp.]|uniref:putative ornithine decarboxylase n=1 Tax=uncultured Lactobacillus sp. TaxID=153152 RepID=UPI00266545C0|nr:putative ornithine decarboxylase [uncultured Lactobacillus sp.]